MIPFNRKRALLLVAGLEAFLVGMLMALLLGSTIDLETMIASLVTLCFISAAICFVIIRKLPPE